MNLITFLLIVAIVGSIVGAFVKGTARTVSLITALLAFVLLVGTPGSQGTSNNFFANLFGTRNNSASTNTPTTQVTNTTQGGGGGTTTPPAGGTGQVGGTGQNGQGTQTTPGNLPASPLPGATPSGDNGRSGTTSARSVPNTSRSTGSGSRTFPSGYTTRDTSTRRYRALW